METKTYAVYSFTGPGAVALFATEAEARTAAQDASASCLGHVWRVFEAIEIGAYVGTQQPAQITVTEAPPMESIIPIPQPTPAPDGNE